MSTHTPTPASLAPALDAAGWGEVRVADEQAGASRTGDEPSDDDLVAAARRGDADALERLLTRHESRVLRVLRLLGVVPAEREDVAQEVFLRVFRHLDSYKAGRSFPGWLYAVTVNCAHDWRRAQHRRTRAEAAWDEGMGEAPDPRPGPQEVLDGIDARAQLERALGGLSERERSVFVLCRLEGVAPRDVARALGITRITVRRHLGLARRRLHALLAGDDPRKKYDGD